MGKKYIIVAQKGDKQRVARIEPRFISIHALQDHLMCLGVSITFTELSPEGTKYQDLVGNINGEEKVL